MEVLCVVVYQIDDRMYCRKVYVYVDLVSLGQDHNEQNRLKIPTLLLELLLVAQRFQHALSPLVKCCCLTSFLLCQLIDWLTQGVCAGQGFFLHYNIPPKRTGENP